MPYSSLNLGGELIHFDTPKVMGILNATPDSFFEKSRCTTEMEIENRIAEIIRQGADMIDVGAYSSRPDATDISPEEEWRRLEGALKILRRISPDAIVSVDTFRSQVARRAVEEYGVQIVNDISGGELDPDMYQTIADLNCAYIMMHMKGTPQTMQKNCSYADLFQDICHYFVEKLDRLRELGVANVVLDPGFGFSKTIDQNYELMSFMEHFSILGKPLLVGISRKSMIYKYLGIEPKDSLNGTTVLNTIALQKGADILRVHDVREAVEVVRITQKLNETNK
ncbi:MAG: dihydropteroate synthase [Bacteroidales bacterium]